RKYCSRRETRPVIAGTVQMAADDDAMNATFARLERQIVERRDLCEKHWSSDRKKQRWDRPHGTCALAILGIELPLTELPSAMRMGSPAASIATPSITAFTGP